MFDEIDATGSGNKKDPRMRNVEAEMVQNHEIWLLFGAISTVLPRYFERTRLNLAGDNPWKI